MDAIIAVQEAVVLAQRIKESMKPELAEHITDELLDIRYWMKCIAPTAWFTSERELVGFVFNVMHKHANDKTEMITEKDKELPDELNPMFMFSITASELLIQIATGKIDAADLARRELSARGTGKNGKWVGFKEAEKQWASLEK